MTSTQKKSASPIVRHPLSRTRVQTVLHGESMTHQSHRDQCDINNIIKRFDNTGELPPGLREPQYADVTSLQEDLTDRINSSRETLDRAGQFFAQKQQEREEKEKSRQIDLENEIKRLSAENEKLSATTE